MGLYEMHPEFRNALIATAAAQNLDYRATAGMADDKLELGYLYGCADLITAFTLGDGESFSEVRQRVASKIEGAIAHQILNKEKA